MATTTDPRASGFNADVFRDAIRFAMDMGKPDAEEKRVRFFWDTEKTYEVASPSGKPYSYTAEPIKIVAHDPVDVSCAVEFISRATSASGTPVAEFELPRLIITLLDEEYDQVVGADWVHVDGSRYKIDYVAPPEALFSVTVYEIYASAEDES